MRTELERKAPAILRRVEKHKLEMFVMVKWHLLDRICNPRLFSSSASDGKLYFLQDISAPNCTQQAAPVKWQLYYNYRIWRPEACQPTAIILQNAVFVHK